MFLDDELIVTLYRQTDLFVIAFELYFSMAHKLNLLITIFRISFFVYTYFHFHPLP